MLYRIGLDIGTNSLGWAAISLRLDTEGTLTPGPLLDMGVRIFSDGRSPKDKSSNAASRRDKRGPRRNHDRGLMRTQQMIDTLVEFGLMPKSKTKRREIEKLDPWILRSNALDHRLELIEIGRALFHLQQRRGFKSNRKADGEESGALYSAIEETRKKLSEDGSRTLGELFGKERLRILNENNKNKKGSKHPMPQARVTATQKGNKNTYDYYPHRDMILDEFDLIWAAQSKHYPAELNNEAGAKLRNVISFQRPLKSQNVGKCTFIEGQPRAVKAMPTVQYARLLQEVSNLRVGPVGMAARELTQQERALTLEFLLKPSSKTAQRKFDQIRKILHLSESQKFNLESAKRSYLVGEETAGILQQKTLWGKDWFDLSRAMQDEIITHILREEDPNELFNWLISEFGIDEDRALSISRFSFSGRLASHGKLSLAALEEIIPQLEEGLTYDQAAKAAFRDHRGLGDGEIHDEYLPYYGDILSRHTAFEKDKPEHGPDDRNHEEKAGRVSNPTVHVALNQIQKVMNDIIRRYGPPEQVVLELARDLPLSAKGLSDLERAQTKNQNTNDARRKTLSEFGQDDTYVNRLKLRLFDEATEAFGGVVKCVFSGEAISLSRLLNNASDIEIEHILPKSRTLDDSFINKVLATRQANRDKGNQTPFEAFGANNSQFDWDEIRQRASNLPSSKNWRFAPDAMEQWDKRGGGFLARHLNDTRYISKLGKTYVEALFGGQGVKGQKQQVWVVNGRLTSDLRHYAGFNTLTGLTDLNQKDRTDHRHHAVDALVVALTDPAMIQRAAQLSKREDKVSNHEIMEAMAEPLKRYRNEATDRLSKLIVSHKPDHGFQRAMHNDTAYGLTGKKDDKGQHIVVTRKKLQNLSEKDLVKIIDKDLHAYFWEATEGLTGKEFTKALVEAGANKDHPVYTVKIEETFSDRSLVVVKHGERKQHTKAYKGDSNYCYEIFADEKGKWTGELVSTYQAYQFARIDADWWKKPHRANGEPLIMRLRNGDMLELEHEGKRRIVRLCKQTEGSFALAEHFESNVDARTRTSYKGDAPLKYIFKAPSSLQTSNALRVTISPSGRLKRHKV